MTDYGRMDKWLGSGELPPRCPYLKGMGSSYYCLVGGAGSQCPSEVVSGSAYACESSVFVARYNRLLNERARKLL